MITVPKKPETKPETVKPVVVDINQVLKVRDYFDKNKTVKVSPSRKDIKTALVKAGGDDGKAIEELTKTLKTVSGDTMTAKDTPTAETTGLASDTPASEETAKSDK